MAMAAGAAQLIEATRLVYDAVLGTTDWSLAAPELARSLGSTSFALFTVSPDGPAMLAVTGNFTPQLQREYRSHYVDCSPWLLGVHASGTGRSWSSGAMIPDPEFERTEFCQDYCRRAEIFYMLGGLIQVSPRTRLCYGFHRPRQAGPFALADSRLIDAILMPHLIRAMQVRERLGTLGLAQRAQAAGLSRLAAAVLVVDRTGLLAYANPAAEEVLRKSTMLRVREGRIIPGDPRHVGRLQALIQCAADGASGGATPPGGELILERRTGLPVTLLVAPFSEAAELAGDARGAAILMIREPDRITLDAGRLRSTFGLTPTESRIACQLAGGRTIEEASGDLQITPSTGRTHLKRIFTKTGARRQAELVSMVLRSAATMDRGP